MTDKVKRTLEALKANGFDTVYVETAEEAKEYLLKEVGADQSVGFGGSVTLQDVGIYDALKERGNEVYWHWFPVDGDKRATMKKAMLTDVYMSGINGITEDGRIINIDGTGNRLSAILFGHDRLFLVAGVNKISQNYEESIIRIKNVACPLNTQRLSIHTPCEKTGKCMACSSPNRICNATLILEKQHGGVPTTVVLINENLGF
ncbi:MAG: lactate utilization protein [Clostridiales bacterium]|nr:lactate utilization protein [Clostridiales bacterium]